MKIRMVLVGAFVILAIISASCGKISESYVNDTITSAKSSKGDIKDGIAISIVYDTSGSMAEGIDGDNRMKYQIANEALQNAVNRIQEYSSKSERPVMAQLIVFNDDTTEVAIPMGKFDKSVFESWISSYKGPNANTPLGIGMCDALNGVISSKLYSKNILVISDGQSNCGVLPENVIPLIKTAATEMETPINTYFIAFDVEDSLFDSIKNQDVPVFSALDANQLNASIDYIMVKRILLEREE